MSSPKLKRYYDILDMFEPIEIKLIDSTKFRMRNQLGDLGPLISSIKVTGLIHPLVVRPSENIFELVSGHRRFEACKRLGLNDVACIIKNLNDREAFEVSLVENIQRQTLDPIEEATAFKRYVLDYGWGGSTDLAEKIGRSEEYVSHRILLLNLPKCIINKISRRQLNVSPASELLWLREHQTQEEMAEEAIEHTLTVKKIRQASRLVRNGASVSEAVHFIIHENQSNNAAHERRLTQHTILALRMCLMRLDSLLDKANCDERNLILSIRLTVHELIDKCIKSLRLNTNAE